MKEIDSTALFRLSVLGPMVSRKQLRRGELQQLIRELAQREYAIPGSQRRLLGEKTIQAWYYTWRSGGIEGLIPKIRVDRGQSKISPAIQEAILAAKRENPRRSVNQIERLLVAAGLVADQSLSRSSVHRLLQQNGLSQMRGSPSLPEEKRSFSAEFAGSIWYGDVMHGPRLAIKGQLRKTYLVSLIDDASRLVAHSAFCLGEIALDIEGVLKQALLRRGVPYELSGKTVRLVVDPHAGRVVCVEDDAGVSLGAATPLDMLANIGRARRKPEPLTDPAVAPARSGPNLVELTHAKYHSLAQPFEKHQRNEINRLRRHESYTRMQQQLTAQQKVHAGLAEIRQSFERGSVSSTNVMLAISPKPCSLNRALKAPMDYRLWRA
jgi:transposase